MAAPVCIFFNRGDYDSVHQGFSIAAAATAMGRPVELYFFWFALERLLKDQLDEPDLVRDDINATMELRQIPTLRQLLAIVRDSSHATLFACTGSLAALGFTPKDAEPKVDQLIGWSAILARTAGVTDRFSL